MATPDGRTLEVFVGGPSDGLTLVFHVGTPAAAAPFPLLETVAAARGLRTVVYSRPGYGGSTRQPGRRVAAAAADTTTILDQLGVEEFVTVGWSGGGPHALACGALAPERCRAVATIGGVAPHGGGFDWSAGMGDMNVEGFNLAVAGGAEYVQMLEEQAEVLATAQPQQLTEHFASLLSAPDTQVLDGPIADFLATSFRRSVAQGTAGWFDDEMTFLRHGWGFDLADVRVSVDVWQARHDLMTPPAHAEWLVAHLPEARRHVVENEGHVSLVANRLADIVDSVCTVS